MKKGYLCWNRNYVEGKVDKHLFGSFLEHLGQCVYGGIYEPGHESADENGFRNDVKALIRELGVTAVRYPGGNFVSGYDWKDGIGPRKDRRQTWNLAWQEEESNQVGIAEIALFLEECGAEPIMAVNLSTAGVKEAGELLEYCNKGEDRPYGRLRMEHGYEKPWGIRYWCLGNEMDGPWEIMSRSAEDYAALARETGKLMKWIDPDIQCIFCGSSTNEPGHNSYGEWDRIVLDHAWEQVDYLSLHRYYNYRPDKQLFYHTKEDKTDIPYIFYDMDHFLRMAEGLCEYEKERRHLDKEIFLAFDEWGVVARTGAVPGGVSQQYGYAGYSLLDAVIYGGLLCTLLNHAARVKIACQSMLVNEGGMIAAQPGKKAIRQTIWYPFYDASHFGRGIALKMSGELPTASTAHHGEQTCVAAAAVYREEEGEITVFLANSDLEKEAEIEIRLQDFGNLRAVEWRELYAEDEELGNSFEEEFRVSPVQRELPDITDGRITVVLKKHSWNVLRWKTESTIFPTQFHEF